MKYVALGDSISIDKYTGVAGGGAASQFAVKLGADFQDLTRDGNVTTAVLIDMEQVTTKPDVMTLTAGGNDFLVGRPVNEILVTLEEIGERLARLECPVIVNTVYDPTDGDDAIGRQMGISPAQREEYERLNNGIREIARERGFLLSDLQALFHGNGIKSSNPWICCEIEPNYLGATAIAAHWMGLLSAHLRRS